MKQAIAVLLAVILAISVVFSFGCDDSKDGELPTLKTGDEWVYEWTHEDIEYITTIEVTGEDTVDGKDCYKTDWSFDPSMYGVIGDAVVKIDKTTYQVLKTQMTGTLLGMSFTLVTTGSYTFSGDSYWPLEVGKEIEVTETTKTTTTSMGETETETETETYTYKVEDIEEITVEAGTFKCFKIVKYDENNKKLSVSWHSDKVKNDVKWIDYEDDDVVELKSYSLE